MDKVNICYDCYDDMEFQVYGQSSEFNTFNVQNNYVSKLNKPSQTVHCEICDRHLIYDYDENKNFWNTTVKEN